MRVKFEALRRCMQRRTARSLIKI